MSDENREQVISRLRLDLEKMEDERSKDKKQISHLQRRINDLEKNLGNLSRFFGLKFRVGLRKF